MLIWYEERQNKEFKIRSKLMYIMSKGLIIWTKKRPNTELKEVSRSKEC